MKTVENTAAEGKRFFVHDFLIGNPIVIDRTERTFSFYNKNIYGQVSDLDNPSRKQVSDREISGLTKRLNNSSYNFNNSKVVDQFIYDYLMTDEQRAACRRAPYIDNTLITASDSYSEAIRGMCAWVFDDASKYAPAMPESRDKMLAYCEKHLQTVDEQGKPQQPRSSVVGRLQEAKDAVAPPQPGSGARVADAR